MKSVFSTPWAISHWPAGELALMEPAGEMWSVVMLSPNSAMIRASCTLTGASAGGACSEKPSKNGGCAM